MRQRVDDQLGSLVALQPQGREHVWLGRRERQVEQTVMERRRVRERFTGDAVVPREPLGNDARRRVDALALFERAVVPLREQPLGFETIVIESEVGPRTTGAVVRRAVL